MAHHIPIRKTTDCNIFDALQDAQRVAEVSSKLSQLKLKEDQAVQARMSSRSRQRANFDAQMVNEALDSLGHKNRNGKVLEEAVRGLRGEEEAQQGAGGGRGERCHDSCGGGRERG